MGEFARPTSSVLCRPTARRGSQGVCRYYAEELQLSVHVTDKLGQTPIFYAASKGTPAILSYLVELGADPNLIDVYGRQPLFYAVNNRNMQVATRLLLEHKADPGHIDLKRQTPVFAAACLRGQPSVDMLSMLLENRAAFDEPDVEGFTPLCWAVKSLNEDTCRRLMAAGASCVHPMRLAKELKDSRDVRMVAGAAALVDLLGEVIRGG